MARTAHRTPLWPLNWLGEHERSVIMAIAAVMAGIWGFALLADEVMEGGTQAIDRGILLFFRHSGTLAPRGPAFIQEAARDMTALGSVTLLALITAGVAGFLALNGKRHMALYLVASVCSGEGMDALLKDMFHRARPDLVPYLDVFSGASFPSGHSMMSALTYLTIGALLARSTPRKRLKAYFLCVSILLTLAVGVTRVYLGVHWPTDVLAGWTAGAIWALICWLFARYLQRRHAIERESESTASE